MEIKFQPWSSEPVYDNRGSIANEKFVTQFTADGEIYEASIGKLGWGISILYKNHVIAEFHVNPKGDTKLATKIIIEVFNCGLPVLTHFVEERD